MSPEPRHVALAIVYDSTSNKLLMITSRAHPHLWILPKGGIEDGETSGQAAVREAWEEAGTSKSLAAPLDTDEILSLSLESKKARGSMWHVQALYTHAEDLCAEWPESHQRKREWVSLPEALERIHQWSVDPTASLTLDETTEVIRDADADAAAKVGGGKSSKKKRAKGGAMELALNTFVQMRGLA